MEAHHFSVKKTTRYYTEGTPDQPHHVYALHGYGQQPQFFLRKFLPSEPDKFLIAPEGLHRYYLNGNSGRVGASWMTKEDRENDILDYVNYLDDLCQTLSADADKLTILGFSQGAATAVRWVCEGKVKPDQLILWAGSFPQDLDLPKVRVQLTETKLILAVGNNDEFISEPAIKNVKDLLDEAQIPYSFYEFEGEHDIQSELFHKLVEL